jgi:hypothetical protein
MEWLPVLSEPEDEEDSNTYVERPQLIASAVKKGLQMADDLIISLKSAVRG